MLQLPSFVKTAAESVMTSSVPLTSTALQTLCSCAASAQPCLHHVGPWLMMASHSLMCGWPGPGGGFAGRPWSRRRNQGNGMGSGPAGTLHSTSNGCRERAEMALSEGDTWIRENRYVQWLSSGCDMREQVLTLVQG